MFLSVTFVFCQTDSEPVLLIRIVLCARFTVTASSNTYTYNPCKAFSLGGGCQDVAVSTLNAQLFVDETTPVIPSSSEHMTLYTVPQWVIK